LNETIYLYLTTYRQQLVMTYRILYIMTDDLSVNISIYNIQNYNIKQTTANGTNMTNKAATADVK